jgi:hypothetical protein
MTWRDVDWRPYGLRATPRFVFIASFALLFLILGCWSYASPLAAAPDEQAHVIHAYAIDHGQIGTPTTPPSKVLVNFNVPMSIDFIKFDLHCWQFKVTVPASCMKPWDNSPALIVTPSYVGHYPPLYYALVGIGGLFNDGPPGIYLMRLISAALGSLMIALAFYTVARWGRRQGMILGVYLAITPITYFLSSSVNPSGFEIMTAIAVWTTLCVLALDYREDPPLPLLRLLTFQAVTLELIRGLSAFWLFLIALVVTLLITPRITIELIRTNRAIQFVLAGIASGALVAATWILTQGTLNVLPVGYPVSATDSEFTVITKVLHHVKEWVRESVGVLGWLDTVLPTVVYKSWYYLVIAVVVIGLIRAKNHQRLALLAVCGLSFVVPVAIVTRQAHILGIVWQGRDSLPLAVGVVIVACGLIVPVGEPGRRARVLLCLGVVVLALNNMLSFYFNLRRYAVGSIGPHLFFLRNQGWSPPTGQVPTLVVFCLATVGLSALLISWIWFAQGALRPSHGPARRGLN